MNSSFIFSTPVLAQRQMLDQAFQARRSLAAGNVYVRILTCNINMLVQKGRQSPSLGSLLFPWGLLSTPSDRTLFGALQKTSTLLPKPCALTTPATGIPDHMNSKIFLTLICVPQCKLIMSRYFTPEIPKILHFLCRNSIPHKYCFECLILFDKY